MKYRVVKFGGSNLKDKVGIRNVLQAVKNYNQHLVIIVSAFYGLTDQLIFAINKSAKRELNLEEFIKGLRNQKVKVINEIVSNQALISSYLAEIDKRLDKLRNLLTGISYIQDIPPLVYAEVLSYGERLSSLTLYYLLSASGISCRECLPEEIGLITNGEPLNASIDLEESSERVKDALSDNITYILPGFYGVSPKGKINLLGRGGSDYSAAAIAACLDAESLDLWKDVKGFLSADPTIVKNTVNVDSLTYEEAGELAYFGSKILHPRTPEPLVSKNITIRIFNVNESDKGNIPLTIINREEKITKEVIKGVSFNDNFGLLKLLGSSVGIIPGILAKSTTELTNEGINIQSVITSQTAINILLSSADLFKAKRVIENKHIDGVNELLIDNDISLIAAVGEGITKQHGIAGRIFSSVAKKEINIKIISFGASSVAIYFIVNKQDRDETIQAIHGEFFE